MEGAGGLPGRAQVAAGARLPDPAQGRPAGRGALHALPATQGGYRGPNHQNRLALDLKLCVRGLMLIHYCGEASRIGVKIRISGEERV